MDRWSSFSRKHISNVSAANSFCWHSKHGWYGVGPEIEPLRAQHIAEQFTTSCVQRCLPSTVYNGSMDMMVISDSSAIGGFNVGNSTREEGDEEAVPASLHGANHESL